MAPDLGGGEWENGRWKPSPTGQIPSDLNSSTPGSEDTQNPPAPVYDPDDVFDLNNVRV
jgi:hypothetical protein